ncbi:hypothetical protein [Paractinoplanes globisporus]|uniref:DUF2335 domain-containing protein n=1 Tax=Paractinoplanes globisporus TaxID=113565 RepID=A0ABW6WH50_9ACTN|nr:hypothetical protein [Actinoplanes globisporus]
MARRNLPVQPIQPVRVVHYVDPAMQSDLTRYGLLNPAEIIKQQQKNTELYLRWKDRQAEIKERDKKFRRFYTGFGLVVGLVFLAAIFIGGWLIWQHLAALGLGALAMPVVLLLVSGLAVGGHRCVTIVQHMH